MAQNSAEQTMIDNLASKTGKSLEDWIIIVQKQGLEKHGQIISFLKSEHGFTHGFANLVAHKSKGSDAGSRVAEIDLVAEQYAKKPELKPIYDSLVKEVMTFGDDIEIAPKNAYVSLRRNKQFALLKPASKTRFEIGLILKNLKDHPDLKSEKPGAMCTHILHVELGEKIENKHIQWLKKAYEQA